MLFPAPQPAPDSFSQFWAAYPRRTAKKDARKAWAQLQPSSELVGTILAALAWQVTQPQWLKDDGAYVPYPATWLRGERWEDEQPASLKTQEPVEYWWTECARVHETLCGCALWHYQKMRA